MSVSNLIDWLSVSFAPTKDLSQILPEIEGFGVVAEQNPRSHYDHTYKLECGGLMSTSRSDKQGILIDLSGQPLRYLRNAGWDMQQQADFALKARGVSRIDFTVDKIDGDPSCTPQSLLDAFYAGNVKARLKPNREITNLREYGGQSVYFGAPSSDVQFRFYDKAAELEVKDKNWVRIELQVRGRTANAFAYDLATKGVYKAGNAWVRAKFNPNEKCWLNACLSNPEMKITQVPRKATSFENWIESSIKPAFKKHMLIKADKVLIEQLFNDLFTNSTA